MIIKQTYVRMLSEQEASYKITVNNWYPVTKAGIWGMGRIIDNTGDPYLIDLHSAEACPHWEIKTVEVEL